MTDEYIKREAALSLKKPFPSQKGTITLYRQYFIDPDAVERLPAADVRPVVHGRWIDSELDGVPSHCSVCKYPIDRFYKTYFCPNCGALMEVDDG